MNILKNLYEQIKKLLIEKILFGYLVDGISALSWRFDGAKSWTAAVLLIALAAAESGLAGDYGARIIDVINIIGQQAGTPDLLVELKRVTVVSFLSFRMHSLGKWLKGKWEIQQMMTERGPQK